MAPALHIVIAGHVDHGKSTLVGRLLHDTDSLADGQMAQLEFVCAARGTDGVEWSFLLDSFQAERDQAVTIDTTRIRLHLKGRSAVIVDAPGHVEFLKKTIAGAAGADAAVLVVDAIDGVCDQTRRHAFMLQVIGVTQIVVVVTKMDAVSYDHARFAAVRAQAESCLAAAGLAAVAVVPVSARDGAMLVRRGDMMPWYDGATLVDTLAGLDAAPSAAELPFRLNVQDVYRVGGRRIIAGRVEQGRVQAGDRLVFSPQRQETVLSAICVWPGGDLDGFAVAGDCVGLVVADQIFVERGHVASHADASPVLARSVTARIVWFESRALRPGVVLRMQSGPARSPVVVRSVLRVIDAVTMQDGDITIGVPRHAVADIVLNPRDVLALDAGGRFALYDDRGAVAVGSVTALSSTVSSHIGSVADSVTADERAALNGHKGAVFWMTGLSGAGKSTLAMAVNRVLHDRGYRACVLDGDNLRHGLNADLGFSEQDRSENIRRAGAVAALMAESGMICLAAFISPSRADRAGARAASGDSFHEIHIHAALSVCEARDPKGLYKKARRGEITGFTGIDAPYDAPDHPDLIVDTGALDIPAAVERIVAYIEQQVAIDPARAGERVLG